MPAMFKNTLSICLSYISEINFHPRHVSASVFLKLIIFSFLPRDPDSVVLCLLAADDGDDADDVALQIHFTLLQSFCCDSGITILRVSGIQCLKQLLGAVNANRNQEELRDLHCMLVTNPQADHCRLLEVGTYCRESQRLDQWVPELVLQER
uniref:Growth arrest and DNA damage inducible beta n=1 Tax=Sander lucioperca TaxID=283035 RepID=A0A8D0DHN0_SANLU